MSDTIFALASPPGRGGVAVIRVSGLAVSKIMADFARIERPVPRQSFYRTIVDPVSRETIDHGLVVYFENPKSFTGEDVAEFYLHGGMAIVRQMLAALERVEGCRMAEPGEFTRRAFENGKMDLTEAEAVADLIDAETVMQKAQALSQLEGGLSKIYERWAEELKKSLAHLEADLEFPDEDMPEGVAPQVLPVLGNIKEEISAHLDDNRRGEMLRDGLKIAVIGAPNAGKSSLVNALAKRDVAIVSDLAGTTRDVIEVHLDLGGYPVILADTAGLRPELLSGEAAVAGHDAVESEGIRRALERAQQADIGLLLFDASALPALDEHTKNLIDDTAIVVFNKTDSAATAIPDMGAIAVSVTENKGLDELIAALIARAETMIGSRETVSLTRARHRKNLEECSESLSRALAAQMPELMAEDVRLAMRALGRITGRVDVEDLLDVIFRDFCIGK